MFTEKETARRVLEDKKARYVESHCWKIIEAENFPHLDLDFYEETKQRLIDLDFWHVGDVENLTLKEMPMNPRTFIRICLSLDGKIQAACYQVKFNIWYRILLWLIRVKIHKVVEFETEFSDGNFITTSNAKIIEVLDKPPQILQQLYSPQTSAEFLFERHKERVSEYIKTKKARPLKLFSLPQMLESQHRMEKIKSDFRKQISWMSKSEWDRIVKKPDATSDEIYREFRELQN